MQETRWIGPALWAVFLALAPVAQAQVDIGFGGVAHDGTQPVEVTADSLTVDQAGSQAVFDGNVIVLQGDLRMTAGAVTLSYGAETGSRRIREVAASGGVLVTRGTDAAESENAVYDVATARLTMSGDVVVTQGPTTVAGDRLILDLATGNGTVEGRVRTLLEPGGDR